MEWLVHGPLTIMQVDFAITEPIMLSSIMLSLYHLILVERSSILKYASTLVNVIVTDEEGSSTA